MATTEVTHGCCRGHCWPLQRSLVAAAKHQERHSSVECPVITEVKVTTQKNGERTWSMRNSNKKNYLVEVQVYQSNNCKEDSFARLFQEPKVMMEMVKCRALVSLDTTLCSVHRVQKWDPKFSCKQNIFLTSKHSPLFFIDQLTKKQWVIYRGIVHREEHGIGGQEKGGTTANPQTRQGAGSVVRGLMSKHEDRRMDNQHPHKKLGSVIHVQDRGRRRTKIWWSSP